MPLVPVSRMRYSRVLWFWAQEMHDAVTMLFIPCDNIAVDGSNSVEMSCYEGLYDLHTANHRFWCQARRRNTYCDGEVRETPEQGEVQEVAHCMNVEFCRATPSHQEDSFVPFWSPVQFACLVPV